MKKILLLSACESTDGPFECNGICTRSLLSGIEPGRNYNKDL